MLKSFLLIFSSILLVCRSHTQVDIDLSALNDYANYMEPIDYEFSIQNLGKKTVEVLRPAFGYDIVILEFKKEGEDSWTKIPSSYNQLNINQVKPKMQLAPGEEFTYFSSFVAHNYSTNTLPREKMYLLREPGDYLLRAKYLQNVIGRKKYMISNVVKVTINAYEDLEKPAVSFLMRRRLPHSIYGLLTEATFTLEEYILFIKAFPDTALSNWAKFNFLKRQKSTLERTFDVLWVGDQDSYYEEELFLYLEPNLKFITSKLVELRQDPKTSKNLIRRIQLLLSEISRYRK